ncbi:MAG: hypothetical protein DCF29_09680 [Alphaproteobacteria bacterium]|nr:MAG: hypothetical protein DCF29_09680 [Alphaproteobacteria bacterium]
MMQLSRRMITGCAAAWLCVPGAAAANEGEPPAGAARVADVLLQAVAEASGVPGMSAAVVDRGRAVWTGTTGFRDLEQGLPIVPETAFRLASVSKLITATAAIRLHDHGQLDLDAPVGSLVDYLDPAWPAMTPRQLAAHTSGLPHYQDVDENRGGRSFASVQDAVGVFSGRSLLSQPGEKYAYSSWGYTLLSAVVEEASGSPFLDYVATQVTTGLDIVPDTGPVGPADTVAYEIESGQPVRAAPHDYSYSWGGAGFRASASAVALFGGRVMTPGFLSDEARDAMWTPAAMTNGETVMHGLSKVAFGWRVGSSIDGERMMHHAGVSIGARSALLTYPERRVSVALLSNASWTSSIEGTAELIAAPFHQPPPQGTGAPCPIGARSFSGTFQEKTVAGTAQFRLDGDLCRGQISTDNALGTYLNGFTKKDATTLQIIALRTDGRLDRAALVSPIGAYEVRRSDGDRLKVDFGGGRLLDLILQ